MVSVQENFMTGIKKTRSRAGGIFNWWRKFRLYAKLCVTSGFIPRRYKWLVKFGIVLGRIWTFIQVGKVTVIGRENLQSDGYTIFCPNHSSMLDAIVIMPLLPENMHYMAAVEQMRGFVGIKGMVMGGMGCFPVDRSRGRTVIQPAIELVAGGCNLALFPEGKISPSGRYLRFKNGAAWIAIGAYNKLEGRKPVKIVPVHICYGTRHEESALNYLKMLLRWRKGATVTAFEPIYLSNLNPLTAEAVIEELRLDITSTVCDTTSLD